MINGLSLFACGGISEYYLDETKVNIRVANEMIQKRCDFYSKVYPDKTMIQGDITDNDVWMNVVRTVKQENVEFIIATPPCQSFSVAGKMDKNKDDNRSFLFQTVLDTTKELKPKYVLVENVVGFMKASIIIGGKEKHVIDLFQDFCVKNGYHFETSVLNAKDYGTPQSRKRSITLLSRNDCKKWTFELLNCSKQPEITVEQTISGLKSLESGECDDTNKWHFAKKHNDRHIEWIRHTPSGKTAFLNKVHYPQKPCGTMIKGYSTTYKRVDWDKPSPTITMANGSISSQNNCHPGRDNGDGTWSDARVMTVYELILLNGLDDEWIPDSVGVNEEKLIRDLLGESFPPKFSKSIIDTIPI